MSIKPSDNLITLIDPENVTSEAFRILRTNISLKDFDFDKVKPSGDSLYVLLKENDEEKAKSFVSEYLDAKIQDIKSELAHYEDLKLIFNK